MSPLQLNQIVGPISWPRAYRIEGEQAEVQLLSQDSYEPSSDGELAIVSNPDWGELGLVGQSGDIEMRLKLPKDSKVQQFLTTNSNEIFVMHSRGDHKTLSCFSQTDGKRLGKLALTGDRLRGGAAWGRQLVNHQGQAYLISRNGVEKLNSDLSLGGHWPLPVEAERIKSEGDDLVIYEREEGVVVLREGELHHHPGGKPMADGDGKYWLTEGTSAVHWDPSTGETRAFDFPDLAEQEIKIETVFPSPDGFAVLTERPDFGHHKLLLMNRDGELRESLEIPKGYVHQAFLRPGFETMVFEHSPADGSDDGVYEIDLTSGKSGLQERCRQVASGSFRGIGMEANGTIHLRHHASSDLEVFDPKISDQSRVGRESRASEPPVGQLPAS